MSDNCMWGAFAVWTGFEKWKTPKGEEEQSHLACQTSQLYVAIGSFESTGVAVSSCRLTVISNWLN